MKYLCGLMLLLSAITAMVLTTVLSMGCSSTGAATGTAALITCEGSAMGYRGIIRVRVGMEQGIITAITVIESDEDYAVGTAAMEELTELVLMYNTTEIDAVSGATETSTGFLKAVEDALVN